MVDADTTQPVVGENSLVLLKGERLIASEPNVTYQLPFFQRAVNGNLFLTNYKLVFMSNDDKGGGNIDGNLDRLSWSETSSAGVSAVSHVSTTTRVEVALGVVHKISELGGRSSSSVYGFDLICKDIRSIRFGFVPDRTGAPSRRKEIMRSIAEHAFPLSNGGTLFTFLVGREINSLESSGWNIYDHQAEFDRLGLRSSKHWRVTDVNKEYSMCETYPSSLAVPSSITDETLRSVSRFRSKQRLQALSWIHSQNQASITRCSQPLPGVLGKTSEDDQRMIAAIKDANPNSRNLVIMDARPRLNAVANQAKGAGFESENIYKNSEIIFLNIGNIHVMRDSLAKLRSMCIEHIDDSHWLTQLEDTHWLSHVKVVLAGAVRTVDLVERYGTSVVVHCSDGWDRTSQLTSLAMLLLDPHYRTIQGFELLIEKEWLSFGHMFQKRIGHGEDNPGDTQRSPIFTQFIDCVWQITQQFPCAFEFNSHLLITILDHQYSCLYGTFLFNCESAREKENLRNRTRSLWTHINANQQEFRNPLYTPVSHVLFPVASMRRLSLWTEYYVRWNPRMQPQEAVHTRNQELYALQQQLRAEIAILEQNLNKERGGEMNADGERSTAS